MAVSKVKKLTVLLQMLLPIFLNTAGCTFGREIITDTHACNIQPQLAQQQVLSALESYEDAMRRMAFTEVADLYEIDGEIAHNRDSPIIGRVSILQLLKSFSNYKVLENSTKAEKTEIVGNLAHQIGRYAQSVLTPGNETLHVKGKFDAQWRRTCDGVWRLSHMYTTNLP